MRGFLPVFKRELFAYFVTPLAWVLIVVFLLLQGVHFYILVKTLSSQPTLADQTPIQAFFGDTALLYMILFLLVPAMTMRLFAEERRAGTIEPLLTAPVSTVALVLAKYLAALVTYLAMWAPTVLYLVILKRTGEVDWGTVASSYLGVTLVGAGYLAIGVLMSALTKSQFLALVLTALAILGLFILGMGAFLTPEGTTLHALFQHVSVWEHMGELGSGVVDSRRLAYYGSLVAVPLFVTTRVVDAWRWG